MQTKFLVKRCQHLEEWEIKQWDFASFEVTTEITAVSR